jgi:large subunit ribosomal protein L5
MRYKNIYLINIKKDLLSKTYIKHNQEIPYIKNIVLSTITSNTLKNKLKIIEPLYCLELITMYKPLIIKAKKSISGFNIRKNLYIGGYITLNKNNLYNFIDKFIHFVLGKFKNIKYYKKRSFNNSSNINYFLTNLNINSEIEYEFNKIFNKYGLYININLKSNNIKLNKLLISHFLFI